MSVLQPFEGATNRTAAVVLERDADTVYPVRWVEWQTAGHRRPATAAALADVLAQTSRTELQASPVRTGERTSSWMTAAASATADLRAAVGRSAYRGYAGSYTGGLNGAYWVDVLARRTDGTLLIRNLHAVGKIAVEAVEAVIEPDLVYPLLRGRDVSRWHAAPSASIILAQDPDTQAGLDPAWMRQRLPLTYEYLARFELQLRARRSGVVRDLMDKGAFYSMYAVGPYTMAPWKVVWPEVGTTVEAAVVGTAGGRPVIPDHTLILVPVETETEAQFVCSVLNSPTARDLVAAYVTGHPSPHVLEHVRVPRFNPANDLHQRIADVGRGAETGRIQDDGAVDKLVRRLWS